MFSRGLGHVGALKRLGSTDTSALGKAQRGGVGQCALDGDVVVQERPARGEARVMSVARQHRDRGGAEEPTSAEHDDAASLVRGAGETPGEHDGPWTEQEEEELMARALPRLGIFGIIHVRAAGGAPRTSSRTSVNDTPARW